MPATVLICRLLRINEGRGYILYTRDLDGTWLLNSILVSPCP